MGRNKQYDEQVVLEKAMHCFWRNGYENTTVRQLEKEMGINQFSIYANFKNKSELYRRVLGKYEKDLDQRYLTELKKEDAQLEEVRSFLFNFAMSIHRRKVPNSCLMVQSVMNIEQFDPAIQKVIRSFFLNMKQYFKNALNNSLSARQIGPNTNVELEADFLVGVAQSISIFSKLQSKKKITDYIDHAIQKIQ